MGSGSGAVATGAGGGGGGGVGSSRISISRAGLRGNAGRSSSSATRLGGSCGNFGTVIRLVRYRKLEHS